MKDRYLKNHEQISRLYDEWIKYGSLIIAFDFDNTVYDYHKKGDTYTTVIEQLKILGHMGCYMICFTSCDTNRYPEIKSYLKQQGIPCHGINIDSEKVPFKGRKIYYNVFYDDRAGIGQVVEVMEDVILLIKNYVTNNYSGNFSGTECFYSNEPFNQGEWVFDNSYPAAFPEHRRENDLIPNVKDLMILFKR